MLQTFYERTTQHTSSFTENIHVKIHQTFKNKVKSIILKDNLEATCYIIINMWIFHV